MSQPSEDQLREDPEDEAEGADHEPTDGEDVPREHTEDPAEG